MRVTLPIAMATLAAAPALAQDVNYTVDGEAFTG